MNSFVMMPLVKPIERITEISLTCSYRLPVIDDDSEKKQMNRVIAMITLNIISRVCSAYQRGWLRRETGTYLFRIVKNVLESEDCELVFQTFNFEDFLEVVLQVLNVVLVMRFVQV